MRLNVVDPKGDADERRWPRKKVRVGQRESASHIHLTPQASVF